MTDSRGASATVSPSASRRRWARRALPSGAVLLVEPDDAAGRRIVTALADVGIRIRRESDALHAIAAVAAGGVEVLVAGALPEPTLVDLTVVTRQEFAVPVLLAHRAGDEDRIRAAVLAGARPMIGLPYDVRDVTRALGEVIVATPTRPAAIKVGILEIIPDSYDVRVAGRPLDLSPIEFELVRALAAGNGCAVARTALIDMLWPKSRSQHPEELLTSAIRRIRRKLETRGLKDAVHTVRGYGYRLELARPGESPSAWTG